MILKPEIVKERIDGLAAINFLVAELLKRAPFFVWENFALQEDLLRRIKVKRIICPDTGAIHFEELA